MLRTLIFKFVLVIWFLMWTPLLLVGLISSKLERQFVLADAWGVLFLTRIIAGIKYEIHYPSTNEDGIPLKHNINQRLDGRSIIASKHMSILEVAILVTHVPNCFFIMKRELLWIPVYGWAFWRIGLIGVNRTRGATRIGLIGVNRTRGATNMNILANKVTKHIMDGMTLIIFPEGTRATPNQKIQLKRGLLFLASHLKLPITPVGVDTGLYWPKHGKMRPGTTHIYFESELPSSATLEEIHEAINRHSC